MLTMTCTERVIAALSFNKTDFMPTNDSYWGLTVDRWRKRHGMPQRNDCLPFDNVYDSEMHAYYGVDLVVVRAEDAFFPGQVRTIRVDGDYRIMRDGWGRLVRSLHDGTKDQTLEVALPDKGGLDNLEFESPFEDGRYQEFLGQLDRGRAEPGGGACTMPRVGGPFLRCWWLRGEEQFLMDVASDPAFVYELVGRVVDHRIAIGLEELRRGNLWNVGFMIADDIAYNGGLFISPRSYEKLFLPHMERMVQAFKKAGASRVVFHSDGDIRAVLDSLVGIGIEAIHPVEPRAGMDVLKLRERYGNRLAFIGGLDNTGILPNGTDEQVREHVLRVLAAGENGGLVVGCHSIGADISLERYDFVQSLMSQHGGRPRAGTFFR